MPEPRVPKVDPVDPYRDMEAWKVTSAGTVLIWRLTGAYGERIQEIYRAGQVVHLTAAERRINSDKALNPDVDIFQNGTLEPVRLLDDEPDTETIRQNPNVLTEEQIADIVKQAPSRLARRLGSIRNPVTLQRVLDVAIAQDASVQRVDVIKHRIAELDANAGATLAAKDADRQRRSAGGGEDWNQGPADASLAPGAPERASYYDDAAFGGSAIKVG